MSDAILEVKNLSVQFPSPSGLITAVNQVSFAVNPGEVLAIVGESGSGKSVSTQAIVGLLPPNARISGSVTYQGMELLGKSERSIARLRGKNIGMIFQDPLTSLTPIYTIGQQIAEAIEIHSPELHRKQVRERVIELLSLVEIPDPVDRAGRFPHQFSGGMRQRVAIAMAVAHNPEIIIADEPTTALDVTVQAQVLRILHRAKEVSGAAVVLITHDLGVVAGSADRVLVMLRGNEVEQGTTEHIFYHSTEAYTRKLLQAIPRISDKSGIKLASDQPAEQAEPAEPIEQAKPVLTVTNLHKYYPLSGGKKFHALKGVSFSVRPRETFAIVGESGSGKTTTIMEILRLKPPEEGTITLFDHDVSQINKLSKKEQRQLRSKIQIVFQDPMSSLDPRLPVGDIIAEPLQVASITGAARSRRVAQLMDQVGLPASVINRYPTQFSGGQRQRIGIARALALEPSLLVLDEPVSALDVSIQATVLNLLHDLQAEYNLAYLFISHNLAVVKNMAHRVGVMRQGEFVEVGDVDSIFSHPQHPYTQALLAASPVPDPKIQRARLLEAATLIEQVDAIV